MPDGDHNHDERAWNLHRLFTSAPRLRAIPGDERIH